MVEGILASLIAAIIFGAGTWVYKHFQGTVEAQTSTQVAQSLLSPLILKAKKIKNFMTSHKARRFNQLRQSTVFFAYRFAKAFPGCREMCEINEPKEAIHRLGTLLEKPISIHYENRRATPIWWFRGHNNMHIESFRKVAKNRFILNEIYFFQIKKLVAVSHPSYFRKFIYIEVDGMEPTGTSNPDIEAQVERRGYAYEEYGEYGRFKKTLCDSRRVR